MQTDEYTHVVRQRMYATHCRVVEDQPVGPGLALVGIRSESMGLNPMMVYMVVVQVEYATAPMMQDFCAHAASYGRTMAGGGVGWMSSAATVAAAVCAQSDYGAQQVAGQQTQVGFGTMLRPVLVDLAANSVVCSFSTGVLGALAVNLVNGVVRGHFPLPADAAAYMQGPAPAPPPAPPPGPPHGTPGLPPGPPAPGGPVGGYGY